MPGAKKAAAPVGRSTRPEVAADLLTAAPPAEPIVMGKPNPLDSAYLLSREGATDPTTGAVAKAGTQLRVPADPARFLPDEDACKSVEALLQRAARDHAGGIRVQYVQSGDGWAVFFTWHKPQNRNYTVVDVRKWALAEGYQLPAKGRVPRDVTDAYRKAHGYTVQETE